jgi:transposase-like protein
MGVVEVDETFIGGKEKNKHRNKRIGPNTKGTMGKTPVIGAISRKGNIVCQMVENTDLKTLDSFVRKVVADSVELVATDEAYGYQRLADTYRHESVRHSTGEYVRGEVHTQNIDSLWSLLKRGVIGTYHHMSKKYLPLYLAEFRFRFNNQESRYVRRDHCRMLRHPRWQEPQPPTARPVQLEFPFVRRESCVKKMRTS